MNFQNPWAFLLILAVPFYYLLRKFHIFEKPSYTTVLGDWRGKIFEWNDIPDKILRFFYKVAFYTGFTCAVIALADPVIRHQEKIYTSRGSDILFVVDTSPSMVAKDVNGKTRLQASKDAISSLFEQNLGARCGIVALGSEAAVIVPPTNDLEMFKSRLHSLSEGSMGDGSAIGVGLSTAVYHLVSSSAPKKCIVLFTDGENNAGSIHPETAAQIAAENNITLYIFGVGSKGTVSINYTDPTTGKQYSGYLNSDFDSASLRKIADIGKGKYFEVSTISELSDALTKISSVEITAQDFTYKTINDSYYQKFSVAAIILILLGWFVKRFLLKYKKIIWARTVFFVLAFSMLVLSALGLSWGTYQVPVQKTSNAVSFVFDISNSMTAQDTISGISRLKSASIYSKKLLEKMNGESVSVILAKGDGVTAIPLTEDYAMIESLLDVLSPKLLSAPGTNLGKAVFAAKNSFPQNISACQYIWLFTDGMDNDGHLSQALIECMKSGVSVSIVGFGSEKGAEVKAGDGKTSVHTNLKSQEILQAIESAENKLPRNKIYQRPVYIRAEDRGSAMQLLNPLELNKSTGVYTSYETRSVNRYKLFLVLSVIFLVLGITISELNFPRKNEKNSEKKPNSAKILARSLIILTFFTGCKGKAHVKSQAQSSVLKGAFYFNQNSYEKAAGEFLDTYEHALAGQNQLIQDFALYNLSASYLKQNEDEAAALRLGQISENAPANVKYRAFFNAGVISYKHGDLESAKKYFRKALEIDGSKVEAKINLELSQKQTEVNATQNETELVPISEDSSLNSDMENAIFQRIKENDKGQWKNSENPKETDLSQDY